jgi:hypothetical protein
VWTRLVQFLGDGDSSGASGHGLDIRGSVETPGAFSRLSAVRATIPPEAAHEDHPPLCPCPLCLRVELHAALD